MSVVPLSSTNDIVEHLDFLYGENKGWVYSPVRLGEDWNQHFFDWPRQKADLIRHIEDQATAGDVYLAPAMFKKPSAYKKDIKGTQVIWTEFDGKMPTSAMLDGVPEPSRRLRSSQDSNQHWYWRLDQFIDDVETIEAINRGIAYRLEADTSAWDANQVLRPPATMNHKHNMPVLLMAKADNAWAVAAFEHITPPPIVVSEVKVDDLPDALTIVAKYPWTEENFTFFRKTEIPQGSRSSAMMRLAFTCAEMRMTDNEIYSILFNADERWGKFKGRSDRERRLIDLINKARLKHPLNIELAEDFAVYGFESFLSTDIQVEWVINELLQRQGYLLLSGPPGTGKTQLSLRWAINMALGREFLGYSAGPPTPVTFFSMEMGHADLKFFLDQMATTLTSDEINLLEANLKIIPLGYGVLLDNKAEQKKIERHCEKYQPAGVFFDSLGSTTTDELSDETTVKKIMDWNDRFRANYDCFTWFIHHNRKAQANNKKPNKLADVYGNQYITARASTVLGVWANGDEIEVSALKIRLARQFDPFVIKRTLDGLNFEKRQIASKLITQVFKPKEEEVTSNEFFNM